MAQKKKLELDVRGMTCDSCPHHVEKALRRVAGVETVEILGWQSSKATLIVQPGVTGEDLNASVERAGYSATVKSTSTIDDAVAQTHASPTGYGDNDFDLLVIGAGSAGFVAAIKGTDLGFRVGLIGHGTIGGTCVNVGCVPSKTLIRAAEVWHNAGHHLFKGVNTQQVNLDWETVRTQKDDLVSQMRQTKYA